MSLTTDSPSRASSKGGIEGTVDEITLHQEYKDIFQNHLTETLRHGTGHFSASMGASIFPPSAHWTAEDKDLFFHALARHSTLRPDLIAADIGSKTVVDVCGYIALLRNGARKSELGVSLHELPAALEMSDKWIAFEEEQALVLMDAVAGWEVDQKEKARKGILHRMKDRKKPVKGVVVNRTWDVRAEETKRLRLHEERRAELENAWEKEDAMEVLDAVDLQTLDIVVRKAMEEQEIKAGLEVAAASPALQIHTDDGPDLASLTTAERRRVKKRLDMRRKRAEAAGKGSDESITRLKPGRKPRTTPKESTPPLRASSPVFSLRGLATEGEESDLKGGKAFGEDGGIVERKKRVRQRGMTKAEKAAAKFAKHGVDFESLKEHELDLFNLRRFGDLMFGNLGNIKYSTIRLMRAYLDEWLAIVVQHTILAAEQERRAKEHTRVWKTNLDEIKVEHVKHALAVLDCTDSKRAVLERLEQQIGESESKEVEDLEDGHLPEPWSCLAREVYPPLINHPCLLDPELELNEQPTNDVVDPPTRFDAFLDIKEGNKVERMDVYNAQRHERMLWNLVGKEYEIEIDGVSNEEEDEDMSFEEPSVALRNRRVPKWMFRRAGGAIKSKPFVNTSDEESDAEWNE